MLGTERCKLFRPRDFDFDVLYIREKTGAQNIVKEIKQYQEKWLQHIQRMDTNRIPKKHYNINQRTKTHRTTEEEMGGPISF